MRLLVIIFTIFVLGTVAFSQRPHIVFIVADDLGWNDVGWRNPDIRTPTLDSLAKEGVVLDQAYVQPICSPSRSAFMTGYYPYHIGTQNNVILKMSPSGLPARFKLLPEMLKELGYSTHLVGKWHLGFCNWNYTPTYRGYDSFLGYYGGDEMYFSHLSHDYIQGTRAIGLDFRMNKTPLKKFNGTYSTYIFKDRVGEILRTSPPEVPLFLNVAFQSVHSPVEVPKKYEDMYKNINNRKRRVFSGMVTALDDAVESIVNDLKKYGFYNNSVIVFTTDNGGQVKYGGNNWPLRGNKFTLWEGGTRANAFVHSEMLKKKGVTHKGLIHAVDWAPTFVHLAGGVLQGTDGMNQWDSISKGAKSQRNGFVYNIHSNHNNTPSGLRMGKYKFIRGFPGEPSEWIKPPTANGVPNDPPPREEAYLFDIENDPLEKVNLVTTRPKMADVMDSVLKELSKSSVPILDDGGEVKGDPRYWGGVWSPGWCDYK